MLPFEFDRFTSTVEAYLDEVTTLIETMRDDTDRQNRLLRDGTYQLAADPTQPYVPPRHQDPVPYLNFAPLHNAMAELRVSADAYRCALDGWAESPQALGTATRTAVNRILMKTERALTREVGLPGRPWFRHQIYAPGFYTGYGVKTLPAVREAIEQRDWDVAAKQIGYVAETIQRFADEVSKAAALIANRSTR